MDYMSEVITEIFFNREIVYCKNGTIEMLCLRDLVNSDTEEDTEIISDVFKNLNLNGNYKTRIEKDVKLYMMSKKLILDSFKSDSNETVILTIAEMYEKYPSKHLDWLQMINNQLLSDSQVTLDDQILIQVPQSFDKLFKLFADLEET